MNPSIKAERFQDLLGNPEVLEFSKKVITESYIECAPGYESAMRELLERAFAALASSRADDEQFEAAVASIVTEVFRKQDPAFWFNRLYKHYKRNIKPQLRFLKLKDWLAGDKVLDLGCGDGLTSLALVQNGYQVTMTDVLDYRDEMARSIPFVLMRDPATIPYPDHAAGTAIVFAVLHHAEPKDLNRILAELRRVSRRVIIEEDCYEIPAGLDGFAEAVKRDAHLREFTALSPEDQFRYLMFVDYFANAITQGLPQMNMPFEFKTVCEWQELLAEQGFTLTKTLLLGFQPGHFNRSCHVWFIADAA